MKITSLIVVSLLATLQLRECLAQRVLDKGMIDESSAVRLASEYVGVSVPGYGTDGVHVTAEFEKAFPMSLSFMQVSNGPAWKVVFAGVEIVAVSDGRMRTNGFVHEVTVWVGAEDGALLGVFTPTVANQEPISLSDEQHTAAKQGFSLKRTSVMPRKPLLSMFRSASPGLYVGPDPTQITAFFGLLTDSHRPSYAISDKPYWVIILAGLHIPVSLPLPPSWPISVSREHGVSGEDEDTVRVIFADSEDGHAHYFMGH